MVCYRQASLSLKFQHITEKRKVRTNIWLWYLVLESSSSDFESCWLIIGHSWENLVISERDFSLDPLSCPSIPDTLRNRSRISKGCWKDVGIIIKKKNSLVGWGEKLLFKDNNYISSCVVPMQRALEAIHGTSLLMADHGYIKDAFIMMKLE